MKKFPKQFGELSDNYSYSICKRAYLSILELYHIHVNKSSTN